LTIQKNYSERLKEISNRHIDKTKMNALEIGCAYGFFGEVFTKKFVNASYSGIDIVPEAIDYGRNILGLNLYQQNYLTFTSVEQYTHIFMWDVIEHLEHPDLFLQKISQEMIKNGELHISTGDINALLPRIQKQNWRLIHPPSHLHYFSKHTLTALLKKYNFKIKCVKYKPVYRSVRQIFYSLLVLNRKGNKLIDNMVKHIPEKWHVPLNTYDIMYIIALRK
jgi:2-polyprenyl-3-methyl-5-hydroxy-6-metoxy-1,4-benzoquinol methylase